MRTLCHSSQPFLRGGKEMELETEFCEESETQTNPPPPPRFPNHPCVVPCPWGTGHNVSPSYMGLCSPWVAGSWGCFWRFLRLS